MLQQINSYNVSTSQGNISVWDSQGTGRPVVLLHANSACKETFRKQFNSELTKKFRFFAPDFSGHGASDKAIDKEKTYSVAGHADVIIEVLKKLGIENQKPFVIGSSLGGHVGLNLIQKGIKLAGILITGTPPIKICPEGFQQGFQFNAKLASLFNKVEFSKKEAEDFMRAGGFDTEAHPFIVEAALKTDGYARYYLFEADMKGIGGDQKEVVETDPTPLCVVHGAEDGNIKLPYIQSLRYKNLFNHVYVVKNAGHSVFWDQPEEFNQIFDAFASSQTT